MTKPQLNTILINYIESLLSKGVNIDPDIALLYAFASEYNLVHGLYQLGIFKHMDDEEVYRINFLQDDVNNEVGSKRMYKCRIPLFQGDENITTYKQFYKQLVTDARIKPFVSKLDNVVDGKEAFEDLLFKYEDFDMYRFIESTIQYYKETEFSKKLSNYLKENAEGAYLSYKREKSNML